MTVGDAPCPCCGHLLWPVHRILREIKAGIRPRAGMASRAGQVVLRAARRFRGAVVAMKRAASKRKPSVPVPSPEGVWDAWLDA